MGGMMGILAGRLDIPLTVAIPFQQKIFPKTIFNKQRMYPFL
jgi:hypothetical protein